jgi:integrase
MAELLYGSGLRLLECLRLRIKDIDFGYGHIIVRDGKGLRQRVTILPESVRHPLQLHIAQVKHTHEHDLARAGGRVYLPLALQRKYPKAASSWSWQYVFPAAKLSPIRGPASCVAIACRRKISRTPSRPRSIEQAFTRRPVATPFGTVSLLIYWKTAMISAAFKNSSVTRMFPPR